MSKIADNILDILGECRTEGNTLYLPEGQLDRAAYQAVNKVLESIGGKWNRKAKGHIFADGDPAELLDGVILAGELPYVERRVALGLTKTELSKRAGVGESTLRDMESGRSFPRWETRQKIRRALEMPKERYYTIDERNAIFRELQEQAVIDKAISRHITSLRGCQR